jgi:hypothetical protein
LDLNKRVYQVVSLGTVPTLVVDCTLSNIGLTCERNSSVSRAADFGYDGQGSFPTGTEIYLLFTTSKQALQNSNTVGTGLGTKRPDHNAKKSCGNMLFLVLLSGRIKAEMTRVEAGSNTSTVNLRVVRGDEMGLKRPRHSLSG